MSNTSLTVLVFATALVLTPALLVAAPTRTTVFLDDGATTVTVDSMAHLWPSGSIVNLVVAADRSTRGLNVFVATKGLFKSGDRVFVTYKYLAWFGNGTLQGVWTLSGSTASDGAYFKYPRGPWAHNELVVGSSPQAQLSWWDRYAPPTEFSMQFGVPTGTPPVVVCCVGMSHHLQASNPSPNRNPYTIYDGVEIPEGVVYTNGARMSGGWPGGASFVDVSDGNDANGIQAWVDSQLGFVCNPDYIRVVWRFIPQPENAPNVKPLNTYYWLWSSYSADYDGTICDGSASTEEWPSAWFDEPRHTQSNVSTYTAPGGPHPTTSPLLALAVSSQLPRGPVCGSGSFNPGIYANSPADGTWLKWSASSAFSGAPSMQITHVVDSAWGTPISWGSLGFANEALADAVWGAGGNVLNPSWLARNATVTANWYTTSFKISTQ